MTMNFLLTVGLMRAAFGNHLNDQGKHKWLGLSCKTWANWTFVTVQMCMNVTFAQYCLSEVHEK